jgi:NAD-dependent dihydropyrimidine dehydrogenase PreA subunit
MGEFIKVDIDLSKCGDMSDAVKWVQVCPVNIFTLENSQPVVVEENEDECTLCMLCIEAFPSGAVTIYKLYENGN